MDKIRYKVTCSCDKETIVVKRDAHKFQPTDLSWRFDFHSIGWYCSEEGHYCIRVKRLDNPLASYRYLIYAIDKHQDSPYFRNVLTDVDIGNADAGTDVIVDLVGQKRYCYGEWKSVDCNT